MFGYVYCTLGYRLRDHDDARALNLSNTWSRQDISGKEDTRIIITDGFTLVNASVAWRPWGRARESALVLSANNIFDVEARRHASFTKGSVPMAGRDIRLSARFSF